MPLSAVRLTRMRNLQAMNLPDTCAISRPGTATSDGRGGRTSSRSTVTTAACRIGGAQMGSAETVQENRLLSNDRFVVTFAHGTDVRAGDRVVVAGRTFEVTGRSALSSWDTATRVSVTERRP